MQIELHERRFRPIDAYNMISSIKSSQIAQVYKRVVFGLIDEPLCTKTEKEVLRERKVRALGNILYILTDVTTVASTVR